MRLTEELEADFIENCKCCEEIHDGEPHIRHAHLSTCQLSYVQQKPQQVDLFNALDRCLEKAKLLEYDREAEAVREQKVYDPSIQSWIVTAQKYLDELKREVTPPNSLIVNRE